MRYTTVALRGWIIRLRGTKRTAIGGVVRARWPTGRHAPVRTGILLVHRTEHRARDRDLLLLALMPGLGNFTGGLVAEGFPRPDVGSTAPCTQPPGWSWQSSPWRSSPKPLQVASGWILGIAFAAGGLFYLAAEAAVERRAPEGEGRMWMIYLAVATDLFGDGLMIGAGTAVSAGLGLVLAAGQVLADLPEGFAAVSTLRANDVPPPSSSAAVGQIPHLRPVRRGPVLPAACGTGPIAGSTPPWLPPPGCSPSLRSRT